MGDSAEPDHDFEHSPDAYDEPGVSRIAQTDEGWVADSRTIVLESSGQEREFWAFQEQVWDALEALADDVRPAKEIP